MHPNQTPATFEKLKNTLALIRDLRKKSKSRSVVSILFVIFKNNFHEIPTMLDMGKEYQVDFVHFKPAIFDHEQMKELFLDDVQLRELQDIIGSVKSSHDISSTDLTTMCGDLEQNQRRIVSQSESGQSDPYRATRDGPFVGSLLPAKWYLVAIAVCPWGTSMMNLLKVFGIQRDTPS